MAGDKENRQALKRSKTELTEKRPAADGRRRSRRHTGTAKVPNDAIPAAGPGAQGLRVSVTPGAVHVALPDIESAQHQIALVDALHRTLENAPSDADWVVDVSEVDLLPLSFAGFLLGLGEKLRNKGLRMRLSGVREGLFASGADSMAFAFSEFTSRERESG